MLTSLVAEKVCDEFDHLLYRLDLDGRFRGDMYTEGPTDMMPSFLPGLNPDVVISRDASDFPSFFPVSDDIEEFFDRTELFLPVVEIYIVDASDPDSLRYVMRNEFVFEDTPADLLACFVLLDEKREAWPRDLDILNGNVLVQEEVKPVEVVERLLPQVDSHVRGHEITDPESSELLRACSGYVGRELYHFEEVYSAYEEGRVGVLVVMLSVFFESYLLDLILQTYPNTGIGEKIQRDGEAHLGNMIEFCYSRGELTDEEREMMNEIRRERNEYAHDYSAYDFERYMNTRAESNDLIEKAIRFYEDEIGVEQSMVA